MHDESRRRLGHTDHQHDEGRRRNAGLLFFDGRSKLGWILTVLGALVILLGILTNLTIFFRPTSLFNTMIILVLLVGGLGLIAKSLRAKA